MIIRGGHPPQSERKLRPQAVTAPCARQSTGSLLQGSFWSTTACGSDAPIRRFASPSTEMSEE